MPQAALTPLCLPSITFFDFVIEFHTVIGVGYGAAMTQFNDEMKSMKEINTLFEIDWNQNEKKLI